MPTFIGHTRCSRISPLASSVELMDSGKRPFDSRSVTAFRSRHLGPDGILALFGDKRRSRLCVVVASTWAWAVSVIQSGSRTSRREILKFLARGAGYT